MHLFFNAAAVLRSVRDLMRRAKSFFRTKRQAKVINHKIQQMKADVLSRKSCDSSLAKRILEKQMPINTGASPSTVRPDTYDTTL